MRRLQSANANQSGAVMLCDEAKQFSVKRRVNQMKTAFCDAIERHSENLVAPRIPVQPKQKRVFELPGDLRVHLRRRHAPLAIGGERIKAGLVCSETRISGSRAIACRFWR